MTVSSSPFKRHISPNKPTEAPRTPPWNPGDDDSPSCPSSPPTTDYASSNFDPLDDYSLDSLSDDKRGKSKVSSVLPSEKAGLLRLFKAKAVKKKVKFIHGPPLDKETHKRLSYQFHHHQLSTVEGKDHDLQGQVPSIQQRQGRARV